MCKKLLLVIIAVFTIPTLSFSKQKEWNSIVERERPLSLPSKTWGLDLGAEFDIGIFDTTLHIAYDPTFGSGFYVPYLMINDRLELHYLLPMIKFFPIKNTTTQDNLIKISGTNFAFYAGITGFVLAYSPSTGTHLNFDVATGHQMKCLLDNKLWMFSNNQVTLDLNKKWSTNASIGVGVQVTDRFSISPSIYGLVSGHTNTKYLYNYVLKLPIDFQFNFNVNHGLLFRTGIAKIMYYWNSESFWGIPIGLQYNLRW